jgi:hypothetical protein
LEHKWSRDLDIFSTTHVKDFIITVKFSLAILASVFNFLPHQIAKMDCIITKPMAMDESGFISDNIIFAIIAIIVPNESKREINEILNVGKLASGYRRTN